MRLAALVLALGQFPIVVCICVILVQKHNVYKKDFDKLTEYELAYRQVVDKKKYATEIRSAVESMDVKHMPESLQQFRALILAVK